MTQIGSTTTMKLDHSLIVQFNGTLNDRTIASVTIAWVNDYPTLSMQAHSRPSAHPGACPQTIVVRVYGIGETGLTPKVLISRRELGFEIVGSGSVIHDDLGMDDWASLANWPATDKDGLRTRSMMFAHMVSTLIAKRDIDSVGGLLQIATISASGVELVPYFRWMSVAPGYGTYVAMRFDEGEWIQEHRPTGTRVRVVSPHQIPLKGPTWKPGTHERFDLQQELDIDSSGVVPEMQAHVTYAVYDPDNVNPQIIRSWGDDPISPNTFVTSPTRRRSRRERRHQQRETNKKNRRKR